MKRLFCTIIFLTYFMLTKAHAADCVVSKPCKISDPNGGSYLVGVPTDWNGKTPLTPFVFFHGHNGSAKGVLRNKRMIASLGTAGYLTVAPNGSAFTFRGRTTQGWAARPEGANPRGGRDDIKFVEAVLKDVERRFPVRLKETVLSGFSSGGSMAWFVACYSQMPLGGVVAVAGGLRRPLPDGGIKQLDGSISKSCVGGPRKLIHIHGFSDRQVPIEGRGIRAWHQGDVFEGLAVMRSTNQCGSRPDMVETKGPLWCRSWNKCESGKPISFCLHQGGHGMPKGWMAEGLEFLRAAE